MTTRGKEQRPYTDAELAIIRENWGKMPRAQVAAMLPGRTPGGVAEIARRLGLTKPQKPYRPRECRPWSDKDREELRQIYGKVSRAELARRFGSYTRARRAAQHYGYDNPARAPERYSEAERAALKALRGEVTVDHLSRLFPRLDFSKPRTVDILHRRAARHGNTASWRVVRQISSPIIVPAMVYPYRMSGALHPLVEIVNRHVPKNLPEQIRADVCQDLVVALLENGMDQASIPRLLPVLLRRHRAMFPTFFGPLSLDAPLFADGPRLGDTINADTFHF